MIDREELLRKAYKALGYSDWHVDDVKNIDSGNRKMVEVTVDACILAFALASAPAGNAGVNCDCGFSAADCRTNPCYRKKVATSGLAPDASYPYCGDAAQPREAEPVTPITNPLVLPAGIKAGDYASRSPIPEAPGGREKAIFNEIAARRQHQIAKGYNAAHDDEHTKGEIARAAAAYAVFENPNNHERSAFANDEIAVMLWPWAMNQFKTKNERENLIDAAAMLVAEIGRIDRALKPQDGGETGS